MTAVLESYARRSDVPKLAGARVGVCSSCSKWSVLPPRYRRCLSCQPSDATKARLREVVRTIELANVKPARIVKPKDQRTVGGLALHRAMAMIKAIQLDYPNVRASDLKPEFTDLWPL